MPTLAEIRAVPKVLLHDHLDGGLRPQTVLELAREIGYQDLPADNVEELTRRLTEWYHNDHLEASFTISGEGPSKGVAALIEGKADIVQSSRQALAAEIAAQIS